MRRLALLPAALLTLAACAAETDDLGLLERPDAGAVTTDAGPTDAGPTDAGAPSCATNTERECALSNCFSLFCPDCEGQDQFTACYAATPPACPDLICPPPCFELDEAGCEAAGARCRVDRCPQCRDDPAFATCAEPSDPPVACPPVACPPCDSLGEVECAEDPGCHRVFGAEDPSTCLCDSPGCCHTFTRCAEGRYADCRGDDLSCRSPAPWCEGPYVISYEGFCYEGCALAEDCAP